MPQRMPTADKIRRLKEKFRMLDTSQDGKLDFREMLSLLRKGNPSLTERELRSLFDVLDLNADGKIDFEEFIEYLYAPVHAQEVVVPSSVPVDVSQVFHNYCAHKGDHNEMRTKIFRKLCRECDLTNERFTNEACDLIFAQVKPKGERSINEREFLKALTLVAAKRHLDLQEVYRRVGDSAGPVHRNTTKADAVRMHDDLTTYTGVRAKMAQEQLGESSDEDPLLDEIEREQRRVAKLEHENKTREKEFRKQVLQDRENAVILQVRQDRELQLIRGDSDAAGSTFSSEQPARLPAFVEEPVDWSIVEPVFTLYAGRNGQMEGSEFLKILKDCELLDPKRFRLKDVDTTFQKIAGRGQHSIGFAQFQEGLNIVAERKNMAPYFIQEALKKRQDCGPSTNSSLSLAKQAAEEAAQEELRARRAAEVEQARKAAAATAARKAEEERTQAARKP